MKQYTKYKDSGIPLMGNIPEHWKIKRLASLGKFSKGAGISRENLTDEGQPVILYGDIYTKYNIRTIKVVNHISLETAKNSVSLTKGDLLFTGSGETAEDIGKTIVYNGGERVFVGGDIIIFSPENQDNLFLAYSLNSSASQFQKILYARGDIIVHISVSKLKNLLVPVPPILEQEQIAKYLDNQTQNLDSLVEKRKQMIELLKEERAAIINEAVTKGLDPKVKMKDSGVEWIGNIPTRWKIKKLPWCLSDYADYRGKTPEKAEQGVFLVTARNIKNGKIDYELSQEYILEKDYAKVMGRGLPKNGDVLFTTEAPLGEVALVDREDIALAQRVIRLRGDKNLLNNNYLLYLFVSNLFQYGIYRLSTGSTAVGIKGDKFRKIQLILPPIQEQEEIVKYIETETSKIDQTLIKIEREIALLDEYRTALISEAVTGKIDVRVVA